MQAAEQTLFKLWGKLLVLLPLLLGIPLVRRCQIFNTNKLESSRNHIFWLQSSLDLWYILGVGGTFKLAAGDWC